MLHVLGMSFVSKKYRKYVSEKPISLIFTRKTQGEKITTSKNVIEKYWDLD